MKNYFVLEFKRILYSKYTLIIFILSIGSILIHIPLNESKANDYIFTQRNMNYHNSFLSKQYEQDCRKSDDESGVDFFSKERENYYFLYQIYENFDSSNIDNKKLVLDTKNLIVNRELNRIKNGFFNPYNKSEKELKMESKLIKYYKDKNVEIYSTPYENNTWNFFYNYFKDNSSVCITLFIILCITPIIICYEFENDVYKILYTSPMSKLKIMFTKLLITLIFSTLIFLISLFISFVITYFMYGLGEVFYPYLLNDGTIILGINYISQSFMIILFNLLFMTQFAFLVSYIIKKQSEAMTFIGLCMLIVYVFGNYKIVREVYKYIPLFFSQSDAIINNEFGVNLLFSVGISIFYQFLLFIITLFKLRRIE